jgi:hypothetical protein
MFVARDDGTHTRLETARVRSCNPETAKWLDPELFLNNDEGDFWRSVCLLPS